MKTFFGLLTIALLLQSSAFATKTVPRDFECSVGAYRAGVAFSMGWIYDLIPRFNVTIQTQERVPGLLSGEIDQVVDLPENYQIVYTLQYSSGDIGNDEMTIVGNPSTTITARLQKKNADGTVSILNMVEYHRGEAVKGNIAVGKFFNQLRLYNTAEYSKALNNSGNTNLSSYDLSKEIDKSKELVTFSFACSTSVK